MSAAQDHWQGSAATHANMHTLHRDTFRSTHEHTLLLCWRRLRERESKLCPWLTLLPKSFGTTLFFSERELDWLRGTTLHKATL